MAVYLQGGMVLLDSGLVAISTDCCCGVGACCNEDSTCNIRTELECIGLGGTYLGNGVPCDPNPCGGGACCCHGICVNQPSGAACLECQGAYYYGDGTACSDPGVDCGDVGCCTHVDTTCHTTVFGEECVIFFAGGFCVEGDTLCCDALTQQHCPFSSDLGSTYCCDLDYTCCGGFDPSTCCNTLTEQCLHPVDPGTGDVGSFCCPIDWTPCGFEPCCDPATQHCCDVGGGILVCFPIGTPCT